MPRYRRNEICMPSARSLVLFLIRPDHDKLSLVEDSYTAPNGKRYKQQWLTFELTESDEDMGNQEGRVHDTILDLERPVDLCVIDTFMVSILRRKAIMSSWLVCTKQNPSKMQKKIAISVEVIL